jgi:hypothetical protein
MKKSILILMTVLIWGIPSWRCKVEKPPEYNIGPDVWPEKRKKMIEECEKGKILYKIHCSPCHGIFSDGKEGVPNFTEKQIMDYKHKAETDPEGHEIMKKISMEQLNSVLLYLRLRNPGPPKKL